MFMHKEAAGAWVMNLATLAIGIDGLAVIIYMVDRASAAVAIPLLLGWQVVVMIYFFRSFVPAYESIPPDRGDLKKSFDMALRFATFLPASIAMAMLSVVSSMAHGR